MKVKIGKTGKVRILYDATECTNIVFKLVLLG